MCVRVCVFCQLTPSMSRPAAELNSCQGALYCGKEGPDVIVQCQPQIRLAVLSRQKEPVTCCLRFARTA